MKPSIDSWIKEVKSLADKEKLGMILIHNGIVRSTSKTEKKIEKMEVSYKKNELEELIKELKKNENIVEIKVWLNEGILQIGDDIMLVLVAGKFRKDVLPIFQTLINKLKTEIIKEREIL